MVRKYNVFCNHIKILKFLISNHKGLSKIVYFSQVFNEFLRTWEQIMHLRMVSKRWKRRIVGNQNTFFFICLCLSLHYNLLHHFNVKALFNLLAPIVCELHFIVECNVTTRILNYNTYNTHKTYKYTIIFRKIHLHWMFISFPGLNVNE